jgi:indolepyruvate ferredoxin oxidoreductase, alpha subunit
MGAGISMAHGMSKVMDENADQKNRPVAIIGDSTFFHTGISSLLDVAYNRSNVVTVILDNRTTAMTGGQENPSMGKTLQGKDAPLVDIPALVRALGITRVREIDPFDVAQCQTVLKEEIAADEPSVVIATSPCVLQYRINGEAYTVDPDLCTGCKVCLRAGCTALSLYKNKDGEPRVEIDPVSCTGCGVCAQLCRYEAIVAPVTDDGRDA